MVIKGLLFIPGKRKCFSILLSFVFKIIISWIVLKTEYNSFLNFSSKFSKIGEIISFIYLYFLIGLVKYLTVYPEHWILSLAKPKSINLKLFYSIFSKSSIIKVKFSGLISLWTNPYFLIKSTNSVQNLKIYFISWDENFYFFFILKLYKSSKEINPGLKNISNLVLSLFSIVIAYFFNSCSGIFL
jgi:presenilin-like A22 family membrane protease